MGAQEHQHAAEEDAEHAEHVEGEKHPGLRAGTKQGPLNSPRKKFVHIGGRGLVRSERTKYEALAPRAHLLRGLSWEPPVYAGRHIALPNELFSQSLPFVRFRGPYWPHSPPVFDPFIGGGGTPPMK